MTQLYGGPLSRGPAYQRYAARNKNYNIKYLGGNFDQAPGYYNEEREGFNRYHPDLAEHRAAFDEQRQQVGGLRWIPEWSTPEKQRKTREAWYGNEPIDPYSQHYTWNKNFKGNPHQDQYKAVPFWETTRKEPWYTRYL
tara:strand:- start:188 stop:604 length:417 start_codon:yes stop_codon:yes gene_type:complete